MIATRIETVPQLKHTELFIENPQNTHISFVKIQLDIGYILKSIYVYLKKYNWNKHFVKQSSPIHSLHGTDRN